MTSTRHHVGPTPLAPGHGAPHHDPDADAAEPDEYSPGFDRPLRTYVALISTFVGLVTTVGAVANRRGRLPERLPWSDVLLVAVATQRLSRTLTKDIVASPVRAPFTRLEGGAEGPAELSERPRGRGWRKAVGELVTCPFCMAGWVSAGFVSGLVLVPRFTRLVASVFGTMAIADFLQLGYGRLERQAAAEKPPG